MAPLNEYLWTWERMIRIFGYSQEGGKCTLQRNLSTQTMVWRCLLLYVTQRPGAGGWQHSGSMNWKEAVWVFPFYSFTHRWLIPIIFYPISAAIVSNSHTSWAAIRRYKVTETQMHQGEQLGKRSVFLRHLLHPFTSSQLVERESSSRRSDRSWWVVRVINCSSILLDHFHPENNFLLLYSPEIRVWPLTSPRHFLGLRHL